MSLKSENKYNVPGLDRALTIIELLNERTEGLSVNEVAAYLKLPVNSVYRIMTTLERRRYIQKSKGEARYNLSEKLLQLTTPVTGDPSFLETVIPYLYELRDQTKESLLAGVILGKEGIVLEQIDGLHNFSFRVNPGLRFPLHTSAPGKAYLADLDEKNRNRIISGLTLTRFTKNTLTSPEKLIDECKRIKKLGYAVDNEEEMDGQICIGSVVKNKKSEIAGAIWLVAPTSRMSQERVDKTGCLIQQTANSISTALGYLSLQVA